MRTLIFTLLMLMSLPAWAIDTVYLTVMRPDGGMSVIVGNSKAKLIQRGALPADATDEDYVNYIRDGREECKAPSVCEQMPDDWFPPFDRRLRNAWKKGADKNAVGNFTNDYGEGVRGIDIDMAKAKGIWKQQMESAAVAEASEADDEVRAAEIKGDNAARTAAQQKRQRLNGVIPEAAIEAAQTPDELMAVWPAELEDRRPRMYPAEKVTERRSDRAKGLIR